MQELFISLMADLYCLYKVTAAKGKAFMCNKILLECLYMLVILNFTGQPGSCKLTCCLCYMVFLVGTMSFYISMSQGYYGKRLCVNTLVKDHIFHKSAVNLATVTQ